jgi:hypothetical protein
MLMFLLQAYLWVGLFTAVSHALKWPFTGSKRDYAYLNTKIDEAFATSKVWYVLAQVITTVSAALLWPLVYYYRAQEIWNKLTVESCTHSLYREDQACDAICMICKKNLGFIQNQREKNPHGEVHD